MNREQEAQRTSTIQHQRCGIFVEQQSTRSPSSVATVLIGKLEVIIFKEAVHENDEFAHAGGHGDEGFLSCRAQAQIKFFKDAVVPHSTQSRHVERAAHRPPPAIDSADSILATAVAIIRGNAR